MQPQSQYKGYQGSSYPVQHNPQPNRQAQSQYPAYQTANNPDAFHYGPQHIIIN